MNNTENSKLQEKHTETMFSRTSAINWIWLYNPFHFLAGTKSLLLGLVIMIITALLGSLQHVHFDGVIDVHFGASVPVWFYLTESLLDWFVFSIFLFATSLILSDSKTRIIDIFGTQALARTPMLLVSFICFIPLFHFTFKGIPQINLTLLLFIGITMIFSIWLVILMYHAYTVSANLKGPKAIISFIVTIILSEITIKLLIIYVLVKCL
jgi:hypothetical protein